MNESDRKAKNALHQRNYKRRHPDRVRESQRRYVLSNQEKIASYLKEYKRTHTIHMTNYRKRYPEKRVAQRAVQWLVSSGKITKPTACPNCHMDTPSNLMHGHHEDYSKPLDVIWMCHACHRAHHNTLRKTRIQLSTTERKR